MKCPPPWVVSITQKWASDTGTYFTTFVLINFTQAALNSALACSALLIHLSVDALPHSVNSMSSANLQFRLLLTWSTQFRLCLATLLSSVPGKLNALTLQHRALGSESLLGMARITFKIQTGTGWAEACRQVTSESQQATGGARGQGGKEEVGALLFRDLIFLSKLLIFSLFKNSTQCQVMVLVIELEGLKYKDFQ